MARGETRRVEDLYTVKRRLAGNLKGLHRPFVRGGNLGGFESIGVMLAKGRRGNTG